MPTRRLIQLWAALALILLGAILGAKGEPLQQVPTFRGGTDLVRVDVAVTDASGSPVVSLGVDAFELSDNGRGQPLVAFVNEVQPIKVSVILDLSDSVLPAIGSMRRAALDMIDQIQPGDWLAISSLRFPGSLKAGPDELRRDVSRLDLDYESFIWSAVQREAIALGKESGRRAILIATDGADSGEALESILSDLTPRGILSEVRNGLQAIGLDQDAIQVYVAPIWSLDRASALRTLSAETGGFVFSGEGGRNNLSKVFLAVANDLRHQYTLGFRPPELDGQVHTLSVRTNRPGLQLRHRRSYVAAR